MKKYISLLLSLLLFSCDSSIEEQNETIDVQFGYQNKTRAKAVNKTPAFIQLTIVQGATTIHQDLKLAVTNFNGNIVTEPIPLKVGSYSLTDYKVLNAGDTVIYATPIEGSTAAALVNDPLNIDFTVSANASSVIQPEVIDTEVFTPEEFGYTSGGFSIVETFHFLVTVSHFDANLGSYVQAESNIEVKSGSHTDFNETVPAGTKAIEVRDFSDSTYTVTVTKDGYLDWSNTYTNAQMKAFDGVDAGETPLNVVLKVPTISSIEAGHSTAFIVKSDGNVYGIGRNNNGQLGDGTTTDKNTFTLVQSDIASVTSGTDNTFFIKNDGTLWGTGLNTYGQLGDGTNTDRTSPVQIMTDVADVSVHHRHTLILKNDGTVWATGRNANGQLGNGATTDINTPVKVMTGVSKASAGNNFSFFLKTDGSLLAAGYSGFGQFGNGSTASTTSTPVQVATNVQDMYAKTHASMILKTDGTVWHTGSNQYGMYGNNGSASNTFVQVQSGVTKIALGEHHSMRIQSDNTLWAAGHNHAGQLGTGNTTNALSVFQLESGVVNVSLGSSYTMIIKSDDTVWMTGSNQFGQQNDGTTNHHYTLHQINL